MPKEVEKIKDALIEDPDFKPQEGKTKEESAWAVAQSKYQSMQKFYIFKELLKNNKNMV